jgi:hypothetical protein
VLAVYTTHASTRKTYKSEQFLARQKEAQQQAPPPIKKVEKGAGKGNNAPVANGSSSSSPKKPMNKAGKAPQNKVADVESTPRPAPTPVEKEIEEGVPSSIAETLRKLYSAATTYRQKIDDIKSKPEAQQFGLEMTEKLLASTEKQIASLEKQYKK